MLAMGPSFEIIDERWYCTSGDMGQLMMSTSGKRSLTKGHFLPSADLQLPFSVVPLRTTLESVLFRRRSFRSFFLISVAVSSPSSSHLAGAELGDNRDMPDAVDGGRSKDELEKVDEGRRDDRRFSSL